MRIRIDKDFKKFISAMGASGRDMMEISKGFCAKLIIAGLFSDTEEIYGENLGYILKKTLAYKVADAIKAYFGNYPDMDAMIAFNSLVIIGNFNCPYCGRLLDACETYRGGRDGDIIEDGSEYKCECGLHIDATDKLPEDFDDWTAEQVGKFIAWHVTYKEDNTMQLDKSVLKDEF